MRESVLQIGAGHGQIITKMMIGQIIEEERKRAIETGVIASIIDLKRETAESIPQIGIDRGMTEMMNGQIVEEERTHVIETDVTTSVTDQKRQTMTQTGIDTKIIVKERKRVIETEKMLLFQ